MLLESTDLWSSYNTSCNISQRTSATTYHFGLDSDNVKEEGTWYMMNCNLEVCFGRHHLINGGLLEIKEWSSWFPELISMLKHTMKECPNECQLIVEVWVERLIWAAEASGAEAPNLK